jgi:hypothetical protein
MNARHSPEWHESARRLRSEGMDISGIAALVGHARTNVLWVLDENGERKRDNLRHREIRKRAAEINRTRERPPSTPVVGTRLVKPWAPHPIRKVINQAAVMPAARLFAHGDIDRDEFLRRIDA